MSRTFFTADHHFGHAGIIDLCSRPFASVAEMDEVMIANWNAVVRPDDVVWHLGDLAHRCDTRRLRAIFDRLHGQKLMIIGNHDDQQTLALPWALPPQQMATVAVNGERLVLMHYGMRVWPAQRRGAIHLYGHSHGRLQGTSRSLDVGVDCWGFCPVDIPQILQQLTTLPQVDPEGDPEPAEKIQP